MGPHSTPEALFRDRYRANAFTAAGVDTIRLTWRDVRRPGRCAAMVRAALATEEDDLRRRRLRGREKAPIGQST